MQGQLFRMRQQLHRCSWRLFVDVWFWDAFAGINWLLILRPLFLILCRFCSLLRWMGIFQALEGLLGWWTKWSMIQYCRRTEIKKYWLFYLWYRRQEHNSRLPYRMLLPNSWIFIDQQCPKSRLPISYLEVDYLSINYNLLFHEICSDCSLIRIHKFLINIPKFTFASTS